MEKGIVERFEGNFAVIEIGRRTIDVKKEQVDAHAKEGDVVYLQGGKWKVDVDETKKRSKAIKQLMDEVWED